MKKKKKKKKYTYKLIDFLVNIKKANNLIVLFHGTAAGAKYPIFRGYDYNFSESVVLSISDPLIKLYKGLKIGWYLDTKKYDITLNIKEIVEHIKKICNIKKVIFVSNCSGALIALKLSCIMNEYCLIANPHTIIKSKDCFVYNHWSESSLEKGYKMPLTHKDGNKKVKILNEFLKDDNNEIISFDLLDSRNFIKEYGIPKLLVCYTHKKDYTAEWILKIKEYCNDNENIKIIFNNSDCISPHYSPFKGDNNLKKSINRLINII